MALLNILRQNKLYIVCNLLILVFGYLFIQQGFFRDAEDNIGPILISIGTSLIASGIVIFLDLWKRISITKFFENINNVLYQAGVKKIYEKRDLDKYDDLMKSLEKELDICGYSLVSFFDSYYDILLNKAKTIPGIMIRILVVDPSSNFSRHRAILEGNMPKDYFNKIERMKTKFGNCKIIQMKKIETPLSTMIFRIDDTMFIGPHFYKKTSKSSVTFEMNKKGWLYEEYLEEFNRMWADAIDL